MKVKIKKIKPINKASVEQSQSNANLNKLRCSEQVPNTIETSITTANLLPVGNTEPVHCKKIETVEEK